MASVIELIHASVGFACFMRLAPLPGVTLVSDKSSFNLFSIISCSSSKSLRPPGAKIFTPLSVHVLCDADTTTPPQFSVFDKCATAGVGMIPQSIAGISVLAIADNIASDSEGPDSRVSRPITQRSADKISDAAMARQVTNLWSRISGAGPRTPSVPNDNVISSPSRLTLGVLRCLTSLLETVLLAFLGSSVSS